MLQVQDLRFLDAVRQRAVRHRHPLSPQRRCFRERPCRRLVEAKGGDIPSPDRNRGGQQRHSRRFSVDQRRLPEHLLIVARKLLPLVLRHRFHQARERFPRRVRQLSAAWRHLGGVEHLSPRIARCNSEEGEQRDSDALEVRVRVEHEIWV
eukprot:3856224-Rhodomonas_salina.1